MSIYNIKQFAIWRLRNILHFLNFDYFTRLLRREGGVIGGSIHIQLITSDFKSSDIDIFVYARRFSPVQQYLYSQCTHAQIVTTAYRHCTSEAVYQDMKFTNGDSMSEMYRMHHSFKVLSVWNYWFIFNKKETILQLVSIEDLPNTKFTPMNKRIKNAIADFSFTQSSYDGQRYNIYGIQDIWNKRLVCTSLFRVRASMLHDRATERHKTRISKYEARGFTLSNPIYYQGRK